MGELISETGNGWYPFPSGLTAVATGSTLKRTFLERNGIWVTVTPTEIDLVDKGEGVNPVVIVDNENPPFAARTAVKKIIPLQSFLRRNHRQSGLITERATFDSTNDLVGVKGYEGTVVTNKHHGHPQEIDELMTIYRRAIGAEYVSSTGIAVAKSTTDLLRIYSLRLRVGVWDPKDFDRLYRIIKEHPDYAGGFGVALAMRHSFVRTSEYVHLEATRLDEEPDLVIASKNGTEIAGKIINARHLLSPILVRENDDELELILHQLALGIIPRSVLKMISNQDAVQTTYI
ncbi:hypothetical protein HY612_05500 [Candidatus Roizmanbacteria bacterium]|nr:hypothetical protein [Candidatus Roizmanbacteria bacterium]